jgi:putative transposase
LKQHAGGETVDSICRELSIHKATFYKWKKHYTGMEPQQIRDVRRRRPRSNDERIEWLVADLLRDWQILWQIVPRKP